MSAFVVGNDCINRIVFGMRLAEMPRDASESDTDFGRRLLALNFEAVRQRYRDMKINDSAAASYEYAEPAAVTRCTPAVASWKALECWLYQCSEGNVPEQPFFQEMENYSEQMGARILKTRSKGYAKVWDLPECERAPWGD